MSGPGREVQEIIIVKRRGGGHDEGHHGGVWKIAFADFMTAMMAFFLVLWIVNSTSKATRSSIARYFNPVQLADTTAARRGLRESKENDFDASQPAEDPSDKGGVGTGASDVKPEARARTSDKTKTSGQGGAAKSAEVKSDARAKPVDGEGADPHAKPASAGKPGGEAKVDPHAKPDDHVKSGAKSDVKSDAKPGGEAAADPHVKAAAPAEPQIRPRRLRPPSEAKPTDREAYFDEATLAADPQAALAALDEEAPLPVANDAPAVFRDPFAPLTPDLAARPGKSPETKRDGRVAAASTDRLAPPAPRAAPAKSEGPDLERASARARGGAAGKAESKARADASHAAASQASASQTDAALDAALKAAAQAVFPKGDAKGEAPQIETRRTPEGVLISLTDRENFEMFAIGSSEPHPRVVTLMGRIAKVLETTPGQVILRGHTDARPFRSGASDNWRLSCARAAMANQMLLRGGLDPARVLRVEGFADRAPRNPDDPMAAENRRIEILVRAPGAPAAAAAAGAPGKRG